LGAFAAYAGFITRHARWVAGAVLLVTVLAITRIFDFGTLTPRLQIDVSLESMLPKQDEERLFWEQLKRTFGSDETLLLVVHRPEGIFERELLLALARLTERLEGVDGVERVLSLANAPNLRSVDGDLVVESLMEGVPEDDAELARIRSEALANPILAGNLVAKDARTASLLLFMTPMPEAEFASRGLDREVIAAAREELGLRARFWLTGSNYVRAETTRALVRDLLTLVPIGFGLMAAIAWLGLRSARGVLLTVSTIGLGVVWTLGIAAELDPRLNLVTVAVPSLILVIGFAYALHVVAAYQDQLVVPDAAAAAGSPSTRALAEIALPTLLTAATTAAGFASLAVNPIEALRQFGIFAAAGTVCTMVASLTWVPALLELLPVPPPRDRPGSSRRIDAILAGLGEFDVRRRNAIFASAALVALLAALAIPRIQISTALVSNFPADSPVREAYDAVNRLAGGAGELRVVLEAPYKDAFKEPENLRALEELQSWLDRQPEVAGSTSLVDYVKLVNKAFHGDDAAYYAIPETRRLVSQLLFFGASDEIEGFVDSQYRLTNSMVRNTTIDSGETSALIDRIEARLAHLPEPLRGRVTGSSALVAKTSDEVAFGQAASLGLAFVVIWAFLSLLFTSLRIGLIAMIPNALPVLVYFGALGWSGVTLNTTTGIVASMVLGIAVDDTIHVLSRYNVAARNKANQLEGVKEALVHVGRPVTLTSIALCLGFLVIGLSTLRAQAEFGRLAAFTLAAAWLLDMTLTPAIASRLRVVTLWDVLSLDLGEAPERAIPLFHGLTTTQARVVALMTQIVSAPAGGRLISAGEQGNEVFVVLDGELRSWVDREGRRIELNQHRRGDVLGEVGLVRGERSANVDCETASRLLRLDPGSLSRLERRYPRIAARLHRNLNETLAGRLVQLTGRLV
jgi:predicted RND superfamily exporter protein/CRP-like cAMP-binding protein